MEVILGIVVLVIVFILAVYRSGYKSGYVDGFKFGKEDAEKEYRLYISEIEEKRNDHVYYR